MNTKWVKGILELWQKLKKKRRRKCRMTGGEEEEGKLKKKERKAVKGGERAGKRINFNV